MPLVQDKNEVQHHISILLFVGLTCGCLMLLFTKFFGSWVLTGNKDGAFIDLFLKIIFKVWSSFWLLLILVLISRVLHCLWVFSLLILFSVHHLIDNNEHIYTC